MGCSISLTGEGFDKGAWRTRVGEWILNYDKPVLSGIAYQYDPESLEEFASNEGEPECWLHPQGGIRGVTLRFGENGVELSLPTGSGSADWGFAGTLANMAAEHGASVDLDGERVAANNEGKLDFSELFDRQWEFELAALRTLACDSDYLQLPVGGILDLPIDTELISAPDFHDQMVARMARYSEAFLTSGIELEKGGKALRGFVAGPMPTLVPAKADLTHFRSEANPKSEAGYERTIEAETFFQLAGDRVEKLGEFNYIPVIDRETDPELVEALLAAPNASTPSPPPPSAATPSPQGELSAEQLATLDSGVVIVFLMIAAADGSIDRKEVMSFHKTLSGFGDLPPGLFKGMLLRCQHQLEHHLNALTSGGTSVVALLAQLTGVREVLNACPENERTMVAQGLYRLAHDVASSSGGGFFGLGAKIDKSERAALELIARALGVNPTAMGLD